MTDEGQANESTLSVVFTDEYLCNNPIEIQFLKNSKFCSKLQSYLQQTFHVSIKYEQSNDGDEKQIDKIQILSKSKEHNESCQNEIEKLFSSIRTKIYDDEKVQCYLENHPRALEIIQRILNNEQEYTVCELLDNDGFKISYFQFKKPFNTHNIDEIMDGNISEELLRMPGMRDSLWDELHERILHDEQIEDHDSVISIHIKLNYSYSKRMRIINEREGLMIFGYYKKVNELKQKYQEFFDQTDIEVFKFEINPAQINYLVYICSKEIRQIETKYKRDGVDLQLKLQQFRAPGCLKDEITNRLNELLSNMKIEKFKTIDLFQVTIEQQIERLKKIALRNRCYIDQYKVHKNISKTYIVPKGTSLSTPDVVSSKLLRKQSDLFCSLPDVASKVALKNGSISVYIGDIAQEKVDAIILPSTSNGLRDYIIEQAGLDVKALKCDPNEQKSNIMFIHTKSDRLPCKSILFTNWTPPVTNDDSELQRSVQIFILKSIQYATTRLEAASVAFAVPDFCDKEETVVKAMLKEAKHQIEKSTTLDLSFILLANQQTLLELFSTKIEKMQGFLQFSCPTTYIKIHVISSSDKLLKKCQEQINIYLQQLMVKLQIKSKDSNGIFERWKQYMINAFYYYCKERMILPIHPADNTKVMELCGPECNMEEARRKYEFLDALQNQTTLHLNSASLTTNGVETTTVTRVPCYNIILNHTEADQKQCQRLADRLIDDGFSVLMVNTLTALNHIDKYDCIIVCLSENLQNNEDGLESVIMKSEGKLVLVKVQYFNTSVNGWLHDYIIGKSFYHLYGSDNYFNLEYDKLLLEVLEYTKPGCISLPQQIANNKEERQERNKLIEQQRKKAYKKKVKKVFDKGKVSDDEMKDLIHKLQILMDEKQAGDETNNEAVLCYRRWLEKAPNISKQNVSPFTSTGDINDAIFLLPEDIRKNPEEFMRKYFQKYSHFRMKACDWTISYYSDRSYGIKVGPFGKAPVKQLKLSNRIFGISSIKMGEIYECPSDLFRHVDNGRHAGYFGRGSSQSCNPWANIGFIGYRKKSDKKMKKMEELDNKYFMDKYSGENEIPMSLKKFIEQKKKNTLEFNRLCKKSMT